MSIVVKNLSYTYSPKTPYEKQALYDVSFRINKGETVGVIGSTGSGKSTLSQHLNALIRMQNGEAEVYGIDLKAKRPDLKKLRATVGMLFQYPEYQLFEDTVLKDVAFGPQNFGKSKEEAYALAQEALEAVGLGDPAIAQKSPFELSGGQKRRAAIAGVIACKPKVLILDEPTAGLDPAGKKEILELIERLKQSFVEIVIMVSHNMDEIAKYCDRVLVLSEGRLVADSVPRELFSDPANLEGTGLKLPHAANVSYALRKRFEGFPVALTAEELADAIATRLEGGCNE